MARSKEFDPEERLVKARDLFWEKGYNATSMQDLVETMRLNRGSIYDTYGDKHSLFLQCLGNYVAMTAGEYRKAAMEITSPVKALENILHRAVTRTLMEGKSCMGVKASFELGAVDEDVHAILKESANTMIAIFESLLVRARKTGEIGAEKDPALLACFIMASLSGFWQNHIIYGDQKMVEKLVGQLVDLIRT